MTAQPQLQTSESATLLVEVRGLVQGVGFRPFVHRLALRHCLAGWIRNDADGVRIALEGKNPAIRTFLQELVRDAPSLARIDSLHVSPLKWAGFERFEIAASVDQRERRQAVSPDVALCSACERELRDPTNRRYRYPFITCTDCGPRFTVIDAMPYDRERTSMRDFIQCPECRREYEAPWDRRSHSQTNSCPACGPQVQLLDGEGTDGVLRNDAAIEAAARLLRAGLVLAVRGLGGFHLAVDATDEAAVRRLRHRKHREAKPLAVMVATVEDAARIGHVGPPERTLLTGSERPIVLLKRHEPDGLAPSVAPGLDTVGVMTAYTPIHHLLLDAAARPLVMTSGNASDEPIATATDEAVHRLCHIADAFLVHNREIVARYDDSVVRVVNHQPVFLRRARGYAPMPIPLPVASPTPLVAVGPHLKNTFTLVQESSAYVSQHIGDLENLETLEHFHNALDAYRRLFRIDPQVAVRDRHPGYLSTEIAETLGLQRVITVQHHHAHVAAVAAEHGVTEPIVGIAFDGTGYGDDGHVWGAEILVADLVGFRRMAHLRYAALPGGDLAARNPWRSALGYLQLEPAAAPSFAEAFSHVPPAERRVAEQQVAQRLNAPLASSMGRLFDAAAAVLGLRRSVAYEGQAAMELESLAGTRVGRPLPFPVYTESDGTYVLDPVPLLSALGERAARGDDVAELAARFHESVARTTAHVARCVADGTQLRTVALSGGVFQNARLLARVSELLVSAGLNVLPPQRLSPNDGAISYGQAAVGAATLAREVA